MKRTDEALVPLLTGLLAFLLLHLFFGWTWGRLFAVAPWPGYEESARLGLLEPWFINTPRSFWLTRFTFFGIAFGFGYDTRPRRWPRVAWLWAGAAIGVAAVYATTRMPSMPAGALGFAMYPFRLLLPVVLGAALGELARRTVRARAAAVRVDNDAP